ncbi:MAG: FGGY family carbohydrate kinase, partial [Chitinophagaceae bacterium]
MTPTPVILIFDVGKTNKKMLIFDEQYRLIFERAGQFAQTVDEDGDPCENVNELMNWVQKTFWEVSSNPLYDLRAVNFSAYGASFIHLNDYYKPVTPLYNYLKPLSESIKRQFYDTYGGEEKVSMETCSPVLGNLNSGMQIYRLKYQKPQLYDQIKYSLHLPQFLSYLISASVCSDITSIGCHTILWDFKKNDYHDWVYKEEVDLKFAPIYKGSDVVRLSYGGSQIPIGVGLHDSSAALIPYLAKFHEPFVLISTGTWCITLNPFNQSPLTVEELRQDCLSYLSYEGRPVKASRLFAGYEHEEETKNLAAHFSKPLDYYNNIDYDSTIIAKIRAEAKKSAVENTVGQILKKSNFESRSLADFA